MGFFWTISNKISGWLTFGRYRDILFFSDKLLKKYFTILSSKEWNVTTAKVPSFFNILVAATRPFTNSLISLFTKILKAWKTFVALWILKFFFFLFFQLFLLNPVYQLLYSFFL